MNDTICRFGRSTYQHGPLNDRIYLIHLSPEDVPGIIRIFEELSDKEGYSKIFVKVPASVRDRFLCQGYRVEAEIPGFYRGEEDGYFMARYLDDRREVEPRKARIREILRLSLEKAEAHRKKNFPAGYTLHACEPDEAGEIAALYRRIFASYPFPIHDPEYIRAVMRENIRFFSVRKAGALAAVASTEFSRHDSFVEMTDFATDPRHTGLNLSAHLLGWMEDEMRNEGIRVAYTICRACSHPVNITFARAGYRYGGTLLNNTHICGSFESMNVWYKPLSPGEGDR